MGFSFWRFMAVLRKEWTQMRRDPMTLRLIIVLPLMQLFLFGYAINSDPKNLPTGLLSADHSQYERTLVEALRNTGYYDFIEAMADPTVEMDPASAIATRLARGEHVPAFGHPLYPDGDPRAAALLSHLPPPPRAQRLINAMAAATGIRPNIDCALLVVEDGLRLPVGSAFAIFAVGRTVGWIAHALEQWRDGSRDAENALFALVFPDLRRLAHYLMKHEREGHTLDSTELVDEVYFRLVAAKDRIGGAASISSAGISACRNTDCHCRKSRLRSALCR